MARRTEQLQVEPCYPIGRDKFDDCTPLLDGFARAMRYSGKEQRWFHVDEIGRPLYNHSFNDISDFRNNFAIVYIKDKGYNLIADNGKPIPPRFCRDIRPVDLSGNIWILPRFQDQMRQIYGFDKWVSVSLYKYYRSNSRYR